MNTVDLARRKEAMHALNPFAPGAGRQPKELVGREQELEIMDRIIARTKAGYSDRGLVYSGLRGVGKTVLLLRMKDMAAGQGLITVRMEATGNETHDYELLFDGISKAILRERRGTLRQKMLDSLKHVNEVSLELGLIKTSIGLGNEDKGISSDSLRLEMMVEELCRELKKEGSGLFLFIDEFQVMSSDLMGTIIGLQHSMGQEDLPFYVIAAGTAQPSRRAYQITLLRRTPVPVQANRTAPRRRDQGMLRKDHRQNQCAIRRRCPETVS